MIGALSTTTSAKNVPQNFTKNHRAPGDLPSSAASRTDRPWSLQRLCALQPAQPVLRPVVSPARAAAWAVPDAGCRRLALGGGFDLARSTGSKAREQGGTPCLIGAFTSSTKTTTLWASCLSAFARRLRRSNVSRKRPSPSLWLRHWRARPQLARGWRTCNGPRFRVPCRFQFFL